MELESGWQGPDYVVETQGLQLTFYRIAEARDGEHTAMLRVSLVAFPGRVDGDIFDSKVILTGPVSKANVVKACFQRVTEWDQDDWYALIERACQMVRHAIEEGNPPVDLGAVTVPAKLPWLMEPLFRDGEHAMIYGAGGSAKSLLALAAMTCIVSGTDYLGFPVRQAYPGLYLDYEDSWETHATRLQMIAAAYGIERPHFYHKEGTAPLPSMAPMLARMIAQEHIGFIVIDSVALACGSDPESADAANAYYRALKALGVRSSLSIAHHAHADDSKPFGSIYWKNTMRNIWFVKVQRDDESELHTGLFHRKANNGPLLQPVGVQILFTDGGIMMQREDLRDVPGMIEELDAPIQIEQAIREFTREHQRGPNRDQLRELLPSIKPASFRQSLKRLQDKRRIQVRMGLFELVYTPSV